MPLIRANLVIGLNGMSRKAGSSRGLSSPADRARFLELRRDADVILIGGSTYRDEPYSKCPLPLYVATRAKSANVGKVTFFNLSPAELINQAKLDGFKKILIEGGVNFLLEPIKSSQIDELYLTRTQVLGDSDKFDENNLRDNYKLTGETIEGIDRFEVWERINQSR